MVPFLLMKMHSTNPLDKVFWQSIRFDSCIGYCGDLGNDVNIIIINLDNCALTSVPTQSPTIRPNSLPNQRPTNLPTISPTPSPTTMPLVVPTPSPTEFPTTEIQLPVPL